jgi:hypothetical protein
MEFLILLVLWLVGLAIFFGAVYLIFTGAVDLFEKFGPLILIAWIVAFIPMLIGSLIWGGINTWEEFTHERRHEAERVAKLEHEGHARRLQESAFKDNFSQYCADKVVQYEERYNELSRSRHDFARYMSEEFHYPNIWNRANTSQQNHILNSLDYPEATNRDVEKAIGMARTEEDFRSQFPKLVQFLGDRLETNSEWLRNERGDKEAQLKYEAQEMRKKDLVSKFAGDTQSD